MSLEFFISYKGELAVIALIGNFDHSSAAGALQKCQDQVLLESPRGIVLHLGDTSSLSRESHRAFASFLKGIKSKNAHIRISSPAGKIRDELVQAGILSPMEIKANLPEAIKTLANHLKIIPTT